MRLTLRTMLAYIDDILDPEDAEVIGKRIEQSEFATTLLHRTRDVMRRLRLGTPDVRDRGAGLDPNTVAEYLDNSLVDDRVLDFEKVCLESDVHLAEVASCHQILALVLGEPAEVDPASRQRMYQLPGLVEAQVKSIAESSEPAAPESTAETRSEGVEPASTARRPKAESGLPGRTAEKAPKRRSWLPTVVAVSAVLACGIVLLALTGQFEPGSVLRDSLGLDQRDEPMARAPAFDQGQGKLLDERPGAISAAPSAPASAIEMPRERGTTGPRPELPSGPTTGVRPIIEPARPGAVVPGTEAAPSMPDGAAASPLAQPQISEVTGTVPEGETEPAMEGRARSEVEPGAAQATTPAPLPQEVAGQFDSPSQVLLVLDPDAGAWQRLRDQEPLVSQARYLSLPTYRPMLRLANQTRLWLIDGTQIELMPSDAEGVPGLVVEYGRLVVETPETAGSRLRLQVGADRSGTITFGDIGSRVAVEVGRAAAWGADPETQPGPLTASLFASSGKILWQEGPGREPVAVLAPVRLTLNEQPSEAVAVEQFPNWIVADTISLLDQRASETVERELQVGRPTVLGLRELADHRRREVRRLALRCLDCLGDFELIVAALDNPEEEMAWPDCVEQLRAAVVRGPLAAAQVRTAMERLHGSEGASLYEMLWKYGEGDEPLGGEDTARLLRYLDHNTLAFRVVSFQTLKRTTKLGLYYRPADPAPKRQPWIQKWQERLSTAAKPGARTQDAKNIPPEGGGQPGGQVDPGTRG